MTLKELLARPFRNWFQPVLFAAIALPLCLLSMVIDVGLIQLTGMGLFFLSAIWLLSSMVVLLFRREWRKAINTLLIVIAIIIAIGLTAG